MVDTALDSSGARPLHAYKGRVGLPCDIFELFHSHLSPHTSSSHLLFNLEFSFTHDGSHTATAKWSTHRLHELRVAANRGDCQCFHFASTMQMDEGAALMMQGRTWVYESDFDTNGLLYWVGTDGRTTPYTNPHTSGKVVVTSSSGNGKKGFIEHSHLETDVCTANAEGSFVAVQLPMPMVLHRYTLRHGYDGASFSLRSWNLEGSNDGTEWVVLRQHVGDTSLNGAYATASWDANPDRLAFSHFRILSTGPNSKGTSHSVDMSGLELYGQVGFAPAGTVRFHCMNWTE